MWGFGEGRVWLLLLRLPGRSVGVGVESGSRAGRVREVLYVLGVDVHDHWPRPKTGLDTMYRPVNSMDINKLVYISSLMIVYRSRNRLSQPFGAARSRRMFSWRTAEPRRELWVQLTRVYRIAEAGGEPPIRLTLGRLLASGKP